MATNRIFYLFAALIWVVPGIIITIKGVVAYCNVPQPQMWWLLLITLCVIIFFYNIFRRVTRRYIEHIATLTHRDSLLRVFTVRGWILLLFMMGLGIGLRLIPSIPIQFTASFYSGLGPMLIFGSMRFLHAITRQQDH